MKNFFSVTIDDDGKMTIDSDYLFRLPTDPGCTKEYEGLIKEAIRSFAKCLWEDKKGNVSFAMRILSMAETAASAEPYKSAEEFWDTMMFHFLPEYEDFCDSVKKPYGFDKDSITRPITFTGDGFPNNTQTSIFPMGTLKS